MSLLQISHHLSDEVVCRSYDKDFIVHEVTRQLVTRLANEVLQRYAAQVQRTGYLMKNTTEFSLALHFFTEKELEDYVKWRIDAALKEKKNG